MYTYRIWTISWWLEMRLVYDCEHIRLFVAMLHVDQHASRPDGRPPVSLVKHTLSSSHTRSLLPTHAPSLSLRRLIESLNSKFWHYQKRSDCEPMNMRSRYRFFCVCLHVNVWDTRNRSRYASWESKTYLYCIEEKVL